MVEQTTLDGHADAEATLRRAWESGRLPHAWLLTGPRGIGKATLAGKAAAFVLNGGVGGHDDGGLFGARDLDAPGGAGLDLPPGTSVLRQVAAGSHPDLHVLTPGQAGGRSGTEITVDQVRAAVGFCTMTPAQAAWRVVVVDPAEAMNANAANALLKLLEEPPPRALLLLVSHAPARLLATLRSRCAQLALAALPEATVTDKLGTLRPELAPADRTALARLADGSIGRALTLADAGGLDLYRELVALLAAMPEPDRDRLHALGDRLNEGGEGGTFRLGGELLGWWLARLARAGATGTLPPEVVPGESEAVRRLLDRVALEQWLELWEKNAKLIDQATQRHLDRKQVVLTLFLDIAARTAT